MRWFIVLFVVSLLPACGTDEELQKPDCVAGDIITPDSVSADPARRTKPRPVFTDTTIFPPGYTVMDSVYGDLNLDAHTDAIYVFGHASEQEGATQSERPRVMMLFLGDSSGRLNMVVRNDNIVYTEIEGQMFGESYAGIEIDSGTLRVNHYGGSRFRWTADYIFEYDSGKNSWFYTRSYATMGDMLGEMNELTETGACIPYAYDTLIIKKPIDILEFDNRTAPVATTNE